ncbi:MAG: pyruvate dehydrogenase (acetyl-transferring) E1 component subunit alpha [Dehalococcoidia bacterium]|nr:pyruvate dehydrogenase (acetyl-transferring) E1 component subunit alpha [Dehalococcoidia bacterium]
MTQTRAGFTKAQLLEFYRQMLLIRRFEERAAEMYTRGKVRGFLHLYIGEEAIAVGTMAALDPADYIVTHYRDHGHALARGIPSKSIMAELFGKVTGTSRGKGGSMHIYDVSKNFMGGYAIVGGQMPIAAGLALSARYKNENRIAVVFFGDGALNEGEFHETLNLASLWKLPVLFYLENNLYGMGDTIDNTYAGGRDVSRAATHYRIPARQVDGMNVQEVYGAVRDVTASIRKGNGPFFLEALTYRFRGHSMADPANYRSKEELASWMKRDPVPTLRIQLLDMAVPKAELEAIEQGVEQEINEAVDFADKSADPDPSDLYRDIEADSVSATHS